MSNIVSYDSAAANSAEAGLASTASSLEATLTELDGFVRQVASNWEGDEQGIYQGIQSKWDGAATEIRTILTQIKTGLNKNTASVDEMRGRVRSALQG